ncbi:MAG: PEP-CTERM sorting domain-containing protein [Planctomycetes bacterium]|nr:PEP-CTERM sorting domain-containing protein [Planctomycetota bacterium]
MKNVIYLIALVLLLGGTGQAAVVIETVSVGDAGNTADTTGYGAVAYNYSIGKYDVTVDQYVEFMNFKEIDKSSPLLMSPEAMLANDIKLDYARIYRSDGGNGSSPVIGVTFWNACRFVNWLNNGQGNSDMETGAYTLSGYNGSDGGNISRNSGAGWFVPSIDEYYKAAFYNGSSYLTAAAASAYGMLDLTGPQWTDSVSSSVGSVTPRIITISVPADFKGSSLGDPSKAGGPIPPGSPEPIDHGGFEFRLVFIPEPATMLLLGLGGMFIRTAKNKS